MPIEPRSPDSFTIDNFLLGFSQVEFQPLLSDGTYGTVVSLGILASEELQKEVETLEMNDGSGGTATTALELVSKLKPSFEIGLFNFRADLAQYIFGAQSITAQVVDAAKAVVAEQLTVPTSATDGDRTFIPLAHGDVDDTAANLTLTCAAVTETITGDGTVNYQLAYKPLVLADIDNGTTLEFTENVTATGALVRTFTAQVGAPASAPEAQVDVGVIATSGDITLFQSVPTTNELRVTYQPSHALEEDFDAADPDMLLDPLLGRIRFPNLDTFAVPDATSALRTGQPVLLDYLYNQKSGYTMQPFTQGGGAFNGKATIKHLPDVGSNFIWTVPSVTIRIDDNALTFGSDDFVQGTVVLNVNDGGGTDRFGELLLSSQTEANA